MTKRLRVSRAVGQKFGRFGDRTLDLGNHDFVVVQAVNEAGKSTFAELVAWLLAGRRSGPTVGSRLVNFLTTASKEETVGGTLFGEIDGKDFEVRREFVIKRSLSSRNSDPSPIVKVSGVDESLADWQSRIAIKNGDDYFHRYRIVTGGPEAAVGVKELLEAMAVAVHTLKSPRKLIEDLQTKAKIYVHNISGRRSESKFVESESQRKKFSEQRKEIDDAAQQVIELEQELRDAKAEISEQSVESVRLATRKLQLTDATKAVGLQLNEIKERTRLDEALKPEDWKWSVDTARQMIATQIGALKIKEENLQGCELETRRCIVKADLHLESLAVIQINVDEVEEVKRIERELTKVREAQQESSARDADFNKQRSIATAVLVQKAKELDTSFEHLARIGQMELDDFSFGDPLRHWVERDQELQRTEMKLIGLNTTRDAAVKAQEEMNKAWERLKVTIPPEAAISDTSASQINSSQRGISKTMYPAIFASIVMVSLIDGRLGALLGFAGVALAIVDLRRTRRRATISTFKVGLGGNAEQIDSAAHRLIDANSALKAADGLVQVEMLLRNNLERSLSHARKHASDVLKKYGFNATDVPSTAAKIRAERANIQNSATSIAEADQNLRALAAASEANAAKLNGCREGLRAVSKRIGLPGSATDLTLTRVAAVLEAKNAYKHQLFASEEVHRLKTQIVEVAGDWVMPLTAEGINARVSMVCDEVKAYRKLKDAAQTAIDELNALAPEGSGVLMLICEPTFNTASAARDLVEVDGEIQETDESIAKLNQEIGGFQNDLNNLATKDHLPEVEMAIAQHEEGVRSAVLQGGALYLAAKIIQDIKSEVEQKSQPDLVREATEIAKRITAGDWQGLHIDSESPDEMEIKQGDERFGQTTLSAGATDVLKLCVRLAAARLHAKSKGVALPLILDDPAGSIDAGRMSRVLVELEAFSKDHQVIVLTHNHETAESIRKLGGHIVKIPA